MKRAVKIFALILVAAFCAGLFSCANSPIPPVVTNTESAETIGVPDTTAAPDTTGTPETAAPETKPAETKPAETTAPVTTKAPVTTPAVTTASETTQAPETTAAETESVFLDPLFVGLSGNTRRTVTYSGALSIPENKVFFLFFDICWTA